MNQHPLKTSPPSPLRSENPSSEGRAGGGSGAAGGASAASGRVAAVCCAPLHSTMVATRRPCANAPLLLLACLLLAATTLARDTVSPPDEAREGRTLESFALFFFFFSEKKKKKIFLDAILLFESCIFVWITMRCAFIMYVMLGMLRFRVRVFCVKKTPTSRNKTRTAMFAFFKNYVLNYALLCIKRIFRRKCIGFRFGH